MVAQILKNNIDASVPTWLIINNSTNQITAEGPYVSMNTTYAFTLTTAIYDFNTVKYIKQNTTIVVQPCGVDYWLICHITNQWDKWISDYDTYADNLQWDPIPVPVTVSSTISISQGLIGAGMAMNLAISIINFANPQSIWSMINQFQILILLPMLGAFMSADIYKFMQGLKITLISLGNKILF